MTALRPMQPGRYASYPDAAITGYARENVEAGRWSEVGAIRALLALEQHAAALGATAMGLNVFATNDGAQKLYRELGYLATNVNMSKPLQA